MVWNESGRVADAIGIAGFVGSVAAFVVSSLRQNRWSEQVPIVLLVSIWVIGAMLVVLPLRNQVWKAYQPGRGRVLSPVAGGTLMIAVGCLLTLL